MACTLPARTLFFPPTRHPPATPTRAPRPAPCPAPPHPQKKKKGNYGRRPKGDTQDVVAARQVNDARLSTLAGVLELVRGGCKCGGCAGRLHNACADPNLPTDVRDSVARHALEVRQAFCPVNVTARAQRQSRIEAMKSVRMYSSRNGTVCLQGCFLGDLRVTICEGELNGNAPYFVLAAMPLPSVRSLGPATNRHEPPPPCEPAPRC